MLEFMYFLTKTIFWIFVIKYIAETIQMVLSGHRANEDSILRMYFRKKFSSKGWNHEETTHRWKE